MDVQSAIEQAWDRYAYVNNSPILYDDPTGHCPTCVFGAVAGGILGAALYLYSESQQGDGIQLNDMGDLAVATGMGALAGGLIGSGVGAAVGSAYFVAGMSGAAMGAAITVDHVENITGTENFSASEHIATGAIAAALTAVSTTTAAGILTTSGIPLTATEVGFGSGAIAGSIIYGTQKLERLLHFIDTGENYKYGENPFGEPVDVLAEMIPSVGEGPFAEYLSRTAVGVGVSKLKKSSQNSSTSTSPSQPTSGGDTQRLRWLLMHNEY